MSTFLDLDNTILDTSLLHDRMAEVLSSLTNVSAPVFRSQMSAFDPDHQGYAFDAHIASYGYDDFQEIRPDLLDDLTAKDLLYSDAVEVISQLLYRPDDFEVLTVGQPVTQNFEIDLTREVLRLHGIDVSNLKFTVIDSGVKGEWLARQPLISRGLLVDDNPVQFSCLPPALTGVQIRRPQRNGRYRYPASQQDRVFTISNLTEMLAYLK